MDETIILESKNKEILKLLHSGEFNEVIRLTNKRKFVFKRLFKFKKRNSENKGFACDILNSCLIGTLEPINYSKIKSINFRNEFLQELNELVRMLLVLEDYKKVKEYETLVSLTILESVRDGAEFIAKNSNNYPLNSINAKIWMDGAGLRIRAEELADYFKRKNHDQNELESLFLKAKLTNTIMNHYPNLVGPDMIGVGQKFEQIGNTEKAKQFYQPVELDFTGLVADIAEEIENDETDIKEEDILITKSLIDALDGLKRLGETIDEEKLLKAKELLTKIEKIAATNII